MSVDYSRASIVELEAQVLEMGSLLLAADEEGGVSGEGRWCEVIHKAMHELLRRGKAGEKVVSRLLTHSNAEVILAAASAALDARFDVVTAKSALEALTKSRTGNGWPAEYARKLTC